MNLETVAGTHEPQLTTTIVEGPVTVDIVAEVSEQEPVVDHKELLAASPVEGLPYASEIEVGRPATGPDLIVHAESLNLDNVGTATMRLVAPGPVAEAAAAHAQSGGPIPGTLAGDAHLWELAA